MKDPVRTTIKIKTLIEGVNCRNVISTCAPEVRKGWNLMLESILHEARVYRGFSYLPANSVPEGHAPGITFFENTDGSGGAIMGDETRRVYFISTKLK